jgi:hypothetical protein
VIPLARIDPVARKMAAFFPQPNLPVGGANNFYAQANSTTTWDNYTIKIDHNFSPRDQVSGRVLWRPNDSYNPFTSSSRFHLPEFGATTASFDLFSGIRYTRTISPSLLAEASVSFSRKTNNQGWPGNTREWAREVGFVGGTTNPVAAGLPQMEITGLVLLGHAYDLPKIWAYNNYQYSGAVTWIKGSHTMKFGGDALRFQYFARQYGDTRGRQTYLGRFSGDPFADFVLGYAQTSRRQLDAAGPYHLVTNYSAFGRSSEPGASSSPS